MDYNKLKTHLAAAADQISAGPQLPHRLKQSTGLKLVKWFHSRGDQSLFLFGGRVKQFLSYQETELLAWRLQQLKTG
jgi:hypothetical protein